MAFTAGTSSHRDRVPSEEKRQSYVRGSTRVSHKHCQLSHCNKVVPTVATRQNAEGTVNIKNKKKIVDSHNLPHKPRGETPGSEAKV